VIVSARPKVLIIGDSISMGYTPHVAARLAGAAEVAHNPGNAGDTDNTAAGLDAWLAEAAPDVVHFNCGLHDIKVARDARRNQVPLDRYRENLARIVERLSQSAAKLIWATITPVIEDRHTAVKEFDRYNRDVKAYNAAAAEIVGRAGIPVDDLHAAAVAAGPEHVICEDGVHFTDDGYRMLAEAVATCLREHL
jgi:lysophospholipase L1-like esterase